MKTARVKVYAKLNLTLEITGKKEEYHTIDSLVCSVDVYDLVVAKKRKDKRINVIFKGKDVDKIPPFENNSVYAGKKFISLFDTFGADITIYRSIPSGAGLGGSSADSAGVILALSKLYDITDCKRIKELADSLGSDTGYMLYGGFCRITGRGELIEPIIVPKGLQLYFLIIAPENGVSSANCYHQYDKEFPVEKERKSNTNYCVNALLRGDITQLGKYLGNDLFIPAKNLCEDVGNAKREAESFSPDGANMTGSGSASYALFSSRELRDWAYSRYRGNYSIICAQTVII